MKKINESQLLDHVRGLREYISIVESEKSVSEGPWDAQPDPREAKKAAWDKLSPEQQKWLGGADPTDPIILARMRSAVPDKPAAAAPAAPPAGAGAKPAGATTTADDGSKLTVAANGQVASTDSDGNPYVPGSNPNLPQNKPGAAVATAPQPGAAAKPKVMAQSDPKVLQRQQQLIAAGAKIKADGVNGPATAQAEKDFGTKAGAAGTAALKPTGQNAATAIPSGPATAAGPAPAKPSMLNPMNWFKEGMTEQDIVKYQDDQTLARIINLTRK
jgi:hypothetical protein